MRVSKLVCRNWEGKITNQYDSVQEASADLHINMDDILAGLSTKKFVPSSGYWSREMVESKNERQIEQKIPTRSSKFSLKAGQGSGNHPHPDVSVPVVQLDMHTHEFIAEFVSMYAAQRETGIKAIANVCKGRAKTAGGYFWMFKSDYDKQKVLEELW